MQLLIGLFDTKNLIPHGYCLSWGSVLLWLHVISDLLITASYYSIPLILIHFIRQRKDLPYPWLIVMFAGFIVACGTTHLMSAITIWVPLYWLDALFKVLTALLSVATAVLMLWVTPRILALPSATELQAEIEQRKTAEEALRIANVELHNNAARIRLLLDSSLDGIISMDQQGNITAWNAQAEQIFGYSAEQALGRELAELIIPSDYRERHRQLISHFTTADGSNVIGKRIEVTSLHADGYEFPLELTVGVLGEKDNYSFVAYVRDLTEPKQSEAALQEAFDRLQKIASQLPGVVFQFRLHTDGSSSLPYASKVLRDIYRIDPEEVRENAAKVFTVVHPDDLEQHLASIQISAQNLSPWSDEYRLKFDDGTERWLCGNALPQREEDGSVLWHGFVNDITERKRMEQKLRDSDEFNISILNSLTSHIAVLDDKGTIITVNNAWQQFAEENGLPESRHNMLGINYLDVCKNAVNQPYGDEASMAVLGISKVLAGKKETFHLEYPCHAPDRQRWFYMNVSPLHGSRRGVVVSHENITERKMAEQAIFDAARYSRSLIEASLDPLVTINIEGKITDVNTATEQVTGVHRDNLIGSDFADYFTDPQKAREGYQLVFSHDFVVDYPLVIRHVSGKITDVLYNASVYYDHNGKVMGVFAAARDITQRKQMEDELKASEEKFRSIIEVSPVPMALNDKQLNITFLNPAFVQTFGYNLDDIPTLSDWWTKAYPNPNYRQWVADIWQSTFEHVVHEHQPFLPIELNICCKNGTFRTVLANAAAISNSFRNEYLVVLYDITDRKQAESQLRAFYELDLVGLTITSPEKGWIRINDCLCNMLEYSEQELRQMTWAQLTHPDDLAADLAQFEKLLANEINGYSLEKRFVSRSGKVIPTLLVVRSVRKANGELDYVTAMVEDISEFKQAEAELKRSNAELEQFAYAVSHDMRQPLRMVTSYLSLIEQALTGSLNEETQQFLDFAVNGAKRMDAMILSLLDYSRIGRKSEAKTRISSQDALDEALVFLSPEFSACEGEIKVSGVWPELFASRDELTRLLQNLIGNALKYHSENQAPQVQVHGAVTGSSLRVEVRDQGIGIDPSQMGRLFKVFSRLQARSRYEGTGVGLALCRKIVEHHGGAIGVESAGEGQGSLFWFELPL